VRVLVNRELVKNRGTGTDEDFVCHATRQWRLVCGR
jgi:hypothetical protein